MFIVVGYFRTIDYAEGIKKFRQKIREFIVCRYITQIYIEWC